MQANVLVKVKSPNAPNGFVLIPESLFNASVHQKWEPKEEPKAPVRPKVVPIRAPEKVEPKEPEEPEV